MCGINLIVDNKNLLGHDHIEKMSARTIHRGPDESRIITLRSSTKTYHLAANRLKITDQSNISAQPFVDPSSKYALLFNGEIYNFHELKNELIRKNVHFQGHSDTEVLYHWIREHGSSGLSKLEGMFALIYIDLDKDELFLARDRFGIKPIYYHQNDQFFIASSEIQGIVTLGLYAKELNTMQISHYLNYRYVKAPETFYKGIFELEHGYSHHFVGHKWYKHRFYEKLNYSTTAMPDVVRVEELITSSLLQQIDSPVPVGLLLSGGVDSTLLLALANKEGFTIPTYSIVNSSREKSFGTNDFKYSRLAAKTYSSDHHEVEVDIQTLDGFGDFISKMDQPIGDSSYIMTSLICEYASKPMKNEQDRMKVLLSGAGADELFAGYNRHTAYYKYLKNLGLANTFLPLLKPILKLLPTGFQHPMRKQFQLMKKLAISHDPLPLKIYDNFLAFNTLDIERPKIDSPDKDFDWFGWALSHDQNNYLIGDVLALSDRASMLHGIELRVPYLNERLANYLNKFPHEMRINKGSKWILKEILNKYNGNKFTARSKEGFGLPLSNWLFDKKLAHLWEIFDDENPLLFEFLKKETFNRLLEEQKRKKEDHGPLLWSILVLAHWLHQKF